MTKVLVIALIVVTLMMYVLQGTYAENMSSSAVSNIELGEETLKTLRNYMEHEDDLDPELIEFFISRFMEHPDICLEFEKWIISGEYVTENPVTVEGYTAKDIALAAEFMTGLGVYNFLITLREDPQIALTYINEGFPIV